MHLAMLVVAGVAASVLASTANAQDEATVGFSTVVPREGTSEQGQLLDRLASHIDQLEARNASLEQSVDAVINRPVADCAVYQQCAADPAWLFEAGYINWRAHRASLPYAGVLIMQPGGSFSNDLQETWYDHDSGFRIGIGHRTESNWDVMFRYTFFETRGDSNIGDPTLNTDAIFANLVDRSLADQVGVGQLDDGRCDAASESLLLDHYVYDLELGKTIENGILKVRPFAGLRFAEIKQGASVLYQERIGANDLDTYTINSNVDMTGWGLRTGGQLDVTLRNNLMLFGRGAASLMLSEFRVQRADTAFNQSVPQTLSRTYRHKYRSVVPVAELAGGIRYDCGRFFLAAGYEFSNWFNMYQYLDVVGYDDIDDQTTPVRSDRGDVSFDGWFVDAGISF
jgi:hypothetical protein